MKIHKFGRHTILSTSMYQPSMIQERSSTSLNPCHSEGHQISHLIQHPRPRFPILASFPTQTSTCRHKYNPWAINIRGEESHIFHARNNVAKERQGIHWYLQDSYINHDIYLTKSIQTEIYGSVHACNQTEGSHTRIHSTKDGNPRKRNLECAKRLTYQQPIQNTEANN